MYPSLSGEPKHLYVATTGSDVTGDGSQANPYRTIQHAVDQVPKILVNTWIIHVADGVYRERVNIYGIRSSTPHYLEIKGNLNTPANCRVTGADVDPTPVRAYAFIANFSSVIRIRGFYMDYCQILSVLTLISLHPAGNLPS